MNEDYNKLIEYLAQRVYSDHVTQVKLSAYEHIEAYITKSDALLRMPLPGEPSNVDLAKQVIKLREQRDELYKELFDHIKSRAMDKITDDIAYAIVQRKRENKK